MADRRHRCKTFLHRQHAIADAGADGIESHDRIADRLTLEIISDQNAELLRLGAGQVDVVSGEIAPEAYATVKRAADAGRVTIVDLGVAAEADSLWFNLKPGAFAEIFRREPSQLEFGEPGVTIVEIILNGVLL